MLLRDEGDFEDGCQVGMGMYVRGVKGIGFLLCGSSACESVCEGHS